MNQILNKPAVTDKRVIQYIDNSSIKPIKPSSMEQFEKRFIIECLSRVENPFVMITVADVAKDLHCNQNTANEIFRRKDFPAICIGKGKKVMYMSYIAWKITRKE